MGKRNIVFSFLCVAFFPFCSALGVETAGIVDSDPPLIQAVKRNDIDGVKKLLEEGVNPDLRDKENDNALNWAAYLGNLEVVKEIMASISDDNIEFIDSIGKYGHTPLMDAIRKNYVDVSLFLLKKRAEVNIKDNYGWTALHHAVVKGHSKIILALIKRDANIGAKTNNSQTPLILAVRSKKYGAMKILLDPSRYPFGIGVKIEHEDRWGYGALYYARRNGFIKGVRLLFGHGAKNNYSWLSITSSIKKWFPCLKSSELLEKVFECIFRPTYRTE
ncbi:ankyrin repeat domain-containing protein [Candidatus Babeliales bacterium]|nr:ankyrin repeat domain-containing protein [Candidatus Babeliales bacterium]